MTAEDDSEAQWRQPKPIVVKKYSSLAAGFFSSPFPQAVPAPLFSAPLVNSLTSVVFHCATFHPRHCLFCLLHELK